MLDWLFYRNAGCNLNRIAVMIGWQGYLIKCLHWTLNWLFGVEAKSKVWHECWVDCWTVMLYELLSGVLNWVFGWGSGLSVWQRYRLMFYRVPSWQGCWIQCLSRLLDYVSERDPECNVQHKSCSVFKGDAGMTFDRGPWYNVGHPLFTEWFSWRVHQG